jgi:hypothetical protein
MGLPPKAKEEKKQEDDQQTCGVIDENTTEISNLVFARDPTIINEETGTVNVDEAF